MPNIVEGGSTFGDDIVYRLVNLGVTCRWYEGVACCMLRKWYPTWQSTGNRDTEAYDWWAV